MHHDVSRRSFLKSTLATGTAAWVANSYAAAESKSPNERLRFACIGVGGKGSSDTQQAGEFGDIVGLCDIDDERLNKMSEKFPQAKKYNDFRKMLDEIGKDVDGVTVSTPDHTHAVAAMAAIKMGKAVYCQKPLTRTVHEARALRVAAKQYKVATQMGNQGTAASGARKAIEAIRAGIIGGVKEVHVWTNRPVWPQAPKVTERLPAQAIPSHVHWDLFLGPAQERAYNEGYHPFKWRGWWDFGTGALGDMACHTANMAYMALQLGYPTHVSAESDTINPETCPGWATITYEFPARDGMPAAKLIWYEGFKDGVRNLPAPELFKGFKANDSGSLLIGEKGTLFSPNDYGASYTILERQGFEDFEYPPQTLPRHASENTDLMMKQEWVAAIKGGPPAMSNFDYAAMFSEAMLLGNVALRCGKGFDWDGPNMKAINCPEAEEFIAPKYRDGWSL